MAGENSSVRDQQEQGQPKNLYRKFILTDIYLEAFKERLLSSDSCLIPIMIDASSPTDPVSQK